MEEKKTGKFSKTLRVTLVVLLIAGILALFGWYFFTTRSKINNLENKLSYLKTELRSEMRQTLISQDSFYWRLIMEPFGWAIRNELLNGNIEKINQYLAQFVKEPKLKQILIMDKEGIIIAATDKKLEEQAFTTVYPTYTLDLEYLNIMEIGGELYIFQPLMGFNERLGTVFVIYTPETDSLLPKALQTTE